MRVIFKTTKKQAANWLIFSIVLFFSFISDSFPLKKAPLPYGRRASIIGAYFTFTVTFTDLFPDFTVTFAVPFFFPVMTPFLETVTIFLLEVV